MSQDVIIAEIESNIELIRTSRKRIAELKEEKAQKKADAWEEASSINLAKQKEDFVKSIVANVQRDIDNEEANIEYLYNRNHLLNDKLVFTEDD